MKIKFEDIKSQADLDKAIAAGLKIDITEATTTLSTKNGELLTELKEARKQITPADEVTRLKQVETDYNELKDSKMKGNDEYQKLLDTSKTQHTTELASKDEIIGNLNGQLNTTLVSDAMTKAMTAAKVNPDLMEGVRGMLTPQVAVIDQNNIKVALVGDKTIPQFVEDWAKTAEGKHYILADQNGGGGPDGNGGGGGGGTDNDKYFDPNNAEFNTTKQAEIYKGENGPTEYDRLTKKFEGVEKK